MEEIQKNNEITKLKNQLIINDAWNNWEEKKRKNFESEHEASSKEVEELNEKKEKLEIYVTDSKMGSVIFPVLYLLSLAFLYAIPQYFPQFNDYFMYGFYASFGALIFVFFRRQKVKPNTAFAALFSCLASSMSFLFVCYIAAILADGVDFASGINTANIRDFEIFEVIRPFYLIASLAFAFILIIISIVKKTNFKKKIKKAALELEDVKAALDDKATMEKEQKVAFETEIEEKKNEFYARHPLPLPEYRDDEIKKIMEILENSNALTIEEALMLYKVEQ